MPRIVVLALAAYLCACGGGDADSSPPLQQVAVLSAFPAEMAPLLEQAAISDTMVIDGHTIRVGMLRGVPIVIAVTGIGLVNATMTTRTVLEQFEVSGVIVSGVAGSTLQIGDVTVPQAWQLKDGTTYTADPEWLDRAREIVASGRAVLERCTVVTNPPTQEPVCMLQQPAVVIGGLGESEDPFHDQAFPCTPGAGDLYGCDTPAASGVSGAADTRQAPRTLEAFDGAAPVANDMETAAIAREAAARGVRFIAFRAVSDGAGDPLMLLGFFQQFSAYYHFAARNAAAAALAFLERLAAAP